MLGNGHARRVVAYIFIFKIYRPDELLYRPDNIIYRPDELLYRPDELLYRPDELLYTVSHAHVRRRQIIVAGKC